MPSRGIWRWAAIASIYEQPPILRGGVNEQLRQLRDYLVRLSRSLPDETQTEALVGSAVQSALSASEKRQSAQSAEAARAQAAALKSLILKTADTVYSAIDELTTSLSGVYVAQSDFGNYYEQIETLVTQTARETVESYELSELIEAADALTRYQTQLRGQIRRGILTDPDSGEQVMGIAISENLQFTGSSVTEGGLEYYELAPGQTLGLYTAKGWQFWINGAKKGWFDSEDGMLHVAKLLVESSLRLGDDWLLSAVGGFGLRYIG